MLSTRRRIRDYIKKSDRATLNDIIRRAVLNKEQKELLMYIAKDVSCQAIAFRLHCDVATVYRKITKLYSKLLFIEEG